jgi:hypothetical protein
VAAAPAYASNPLLGAVLIDNGTADTSFSAPSHATLLVTAASTGTKITEIDFTPGGTISSGGVVVNIFLYNGTTYYLAPNGSVLVAAVTPATQVAPPTVQNYYDNLVLPSGWSLYATETIASQPVFVIAFGASL